MARRLDTIDTEPVHCDSVQMCPGPIGDHRPQREIGAPQRAQRQIEPRAAQPRQRHVAERLRRHVRRHHRSGQHRHIEQPALHLFVKNLAGIDGELDDQAVR